MGAASSSTATLTTPPLVTPVQHARSFTADQHRTAWAAAASAASPQLPHQTPLRRAGESNALRLAAKYHSPVKPDANDNDENSDLSRAVAPSPRKHTVAGGKQAKQPGSSSVHGPTSGPPPSATYSRHALVAPSSQRVLSIAVPQQQQPPSAKPTHSDAASVPSQTRRISHVSSTAVVSTRLSDSSASSSVANSTASSASNSAENSPTSQAHARSNAIPPLMTSDTPLPPPNLPLARHSVSAVAVAIGDRRASASTANAPAGIPVVHGRPLPSNTTLNGSSQMPRSAVSTTVASVATPAVATPRQSTAFIRTASVSLHNAPAAAAFASPLPPAFVDSLFWSSDTSRSDPFIPANSVSLVIDATAYPALKRSLVHAMDLASLMHPTHAQLDLLWRYFQATTMACAVPPNSSAVQPSGSILTKRTLLFVASEIHARLMLECVYALKTREGATKWSKIRRTVEKERTYLLPPLPPGAKKKAKPDDASLPSTTPSQLAHLRATAALLFRAMSRSVNPETATGITRAEFLTSWSTIAQQLFQACNRRKNSGSGGKDGEDDGVIKCVVM